ncbi:MAG TPA: prepilin-type N-terminal cleavage/methylation domain-containing protein [Candidatus Saccharimonadales bacterium]|nr:prepilin-type N-terminal cleavage/methylation domain-containing protein [Candidatus Saccharimonadales bacterium]
MKKLLKNQKGFTLIELLVVIVVLGVLATVIIIAINPLEQIARARDGGRKTTLSQLQSAVQAYYTSHSAVYPTANATWLTTLQSSGELKSPPAATTYTISGTGACTTNAQNGWCYTTNANGEASVFVRLESSSEKSKCAAGNPYFVFDSSLNQSCIVCSLADPTVGTACNATQ